MKVFTLYVGASHPSAKATLLGLLERHFESFTVISGEGYFRGAAEPMWFVKVATNEHHKIFATANSIRVALEQDIVGIEYQNQYYKCTAEDDAQALKAFLNNETYPSH